jgi:hypothetical protein
MNPNRILNSSQKKFCKNGTNQKNTHTFTKYILVLKFERSNRALKKNRVVRNLKRVSISLQTNKPFNGFVSHDFFFQCDAK